MVLAVCREIPQVFTSFQLLRHGSWWSKVGDATYSMVRCNTGRHGISPVSTSAIRKSNPDFPLLRVDSPCVQSNIKERGYPPRDLGVGTLHESTYKRIRTSHSKAQSHAPQSSPSVGILLDLTKWVQHARRASCGADPTNGDPRHNSTRGAWRARGLGLAFILGLSLRGIEGGRGQGRKSDEPPTIAQEKFGRGDTVVGEARTHIHTQTTSQEEQERTVKHIKLPNPH